MVNRTFNAKCEICARIYSIESSNEHHCFECKSMIEIQKNCVPNHCCVKCGRNYYSPNSPKNCHFCAVKQSSQRTNPLTENRKNPIDITKKKKRRRSLQELNKIAEHKRVWDDSGWDHYLKGRKWDKI